MEETISGMSELILSEAFNVVITHGNGPQVGNILIQNALGTGEVPAMPMFVCGAMSQGQLGYLIQQAVKKTLNDRGLNKEVATVVTQVEVSKEDKAFSPFLR